MADLLPQASAIQGKYNGSDSDDEPIISGPRRTSLSTRQLSRLPINRLKDGNESYSDSLAVLSKQAASPQRSSTNPMSKKGKQPQRDASANFEILRPQHNSRVSKQRDRAGSPTFKTNTLSVRRDHHKPEGIPLGEETSLDDLTPAQQLYIQDMIKQFRHENARSNRRGSGGSNSTTDSGWSVDTPAYSDESARFPSIPGSSTDRKSVV